MYFLPPKKPRVLIETLGLNTWHIGVSRFWRQGESSKVLPPWILPGSPRTGHPVT